MEWLAVAGFFIAPVFSRRIAHIQAMTAAENSLDSAKSQLSLNFSAP
jgi:hypothetical protein